MVHNGANALYFWHFVDFQLIEYLQPEKICGTSLHFADMINTFRSFTGLKRAGQSAGSGIAPWAA